MDPSLFDHKAQNISNVGEKGLLETVGPGGGGGVLTQTSQVTDKEMLAQNKEIPYEVRVT